MKLVKSSKLEEIPAGRSERHLLPAVLPTEHIKQQHHPDGAKLPAPQPCTEAQPHTYQSQEGSWGPWGFWLGCGWRCWRSSVPARLQSAAWPAWCHPSSPGPAGTQRQKVPFLSLLFFFFPPLVLLSQWEIKPLFDCTTEAPSTRQSQTPNTDISFVLPPVCTHTASARVCKQQRAIDCLGILQKSPPRSINQHVCFQAVL